MNFLKNMFRKELINIDNIFYQKLKIEVDRAYRQMNYFHLNFVPPAPTFKLKDSLHMLMK
jgi:hypothetical protein